METQTAEPAPVGPFIVDNFREQPQPTLAEARMHAGWLQHKGVHRSLTIYDATGRPVDLKRF